MFPSSTETGMVSEIAKIEPTSFFSGDTVKWRREDLTVDYPASAGWSLKYYFRGPAQPATITADVDGDAFEVTLPASVTQNWNASDLYTDVYWWVAKVENGSEVYTVSNGEILVKKNLADAQQSFDGRGHVKRTLDSLEATIERLSAQDLASYTMAGRSAIRQDLNRLMDMRDKYKAIYISELNEQRADRGEAPRNLLLARLP